MNRHSPAPRPAGVGPSPTDLGRRIALPALLALALLLPAGAGAAAIQLGQIAPSGTPSYCGTGAAELLQLQTAGVNPYFVPADGRIVSWSTMAGVAANQQVSMRVYRPVPGAIDTYVVAAQDGPRTPKPSAFNSFATDVSVQAGDFIGIASGPGSKSAPVTCLFATGRITDILSVAEQAVPLGGTAVIPAVVAGGRPNLAATLLPRPLVSSLSPSAGPTGGGTQVLIRGAHLDGATAVSFGGAPASGFTVVSDTEILAVSPPWASSAAVDVSVSVGAVTSPRSAKFVYEGPAQAGPAPQASRLDGALCVVPKLRGLKLAAARRALRDGGCRLGIATGSRRLGKARVKRQSPREGRTLAGGSSVDVVLALKRRRR